jgi:hypothetical protein
MAGLKEELPRPGSFKRFEKLPGAPLLIVRGRDGAIPRLQQYAPSPGRAAVPRGGRCGVPRRQYRSHAYNFDGEARD